MPERHEKMMLREKIKKKEARVGVIGLGYVGLPLAVAFAKAGFSVTGIDIDGDVVDPHARQRSHQVLNGTDGTIGRLSEEGAEIGRADLRRHRAHGHDEFFTVITVENDTGIGLGRIECNGNIVAGMDAHASQAYRPRNGGLIAVYINTHKANQFP